MEKKEIEKKSILNGLNSQNNNDKNKLAMYNNEVLNKLKLVLLEKISFFSEKLKTESQITIVEKYLDLLLIFYDLLKKFSDLGI